MYVYTDIYTLYALYYTMTVRSIFKRHTSFLQGYYCACCDECGLMYVRK